MHLFSSLKFVIFCLITSLFSLINAQKIDSASHGDFEIKGFHLDLRIERMTPDALKKFADEIAKVGMNTLVMEWEGTFPFEKQATISNEYSYSKEEVVDFISHCDQLGIRVIPLQQSLGHVEYILRNPRYAMLKEDRKDISQLCPMQVDQNRALFTDLFSELAVVHNSDYIHIGGDETYLLGHDKRCKEKVSRVGKSKLFVDHMKMIAEIVISQGKIPVMWADIILKYPEAVEELPKETIFVDWNYGWKTNHFGNVSKLQDLGFTFWGAPSIRCHPDNWYVTDWATHFRNQKQFIPYSREAGYDGMIMTSWSTTGVYGFTWDVNYDVIDMIQVRNTYPMSGFKILIASYVEALNSKDSLDPETFVFEYGKKNFGLTAKECELLWLFLNLDPELIVNGKPQRCKDVVCMIEKSEAIAESLAAISPTKNKEEFSHFKLMADLRLHYLEFKKVEERYNSSDYKVEFSGELLEELESIIEDAKRLDKRFSRLNSGFLYDTELDEQNKLRLQPVLVLYDRLAKLK